MEHEPAGCSHAPSRSDETAVTRAALSLTLVLLCAATGARAQAPAPGIDFAKQIQPVLESNCIACHGTAQAAGGLRLNTKPSVTKGGTHGPAIIPGQPEKSPLYTVVELAPGQRGAMPPGGPQLTKAQRDTIRQWIAAGANWPENLTIGATGKKAPDDLALVERLHKRIAANSKAKASDMQRYKTTIPGTDVSFEMVPMPGGEFTMGTAESERGRRKDEGPQHRVRVDPFWMGKYEVTWDEYRLFMFSQQAGEVPGKDPEVDAISRPTRPYVEMSFGMGLNGFPAISMTQHAGNKFAQWLSAKTGHFYRLPTEAEWEYACRAGTTTAYSFGDDASQLGEYGWFADNSDNKYQPVGKKKPNSWGLYDMHGNVMEWTLDQYAPEYQQDAGRVSENPWLQSTKPYPQTARGGSWMDDANRLRCGARSASDPSWKMQDPQLPKSIWYHTDAQGLGLRLVRPLKVPTAREMFGYWNNGVERDE
jgi:formylglycine-generating enzyme required for sulfatase activity